MKNNDYRRLRTSAYAWCQHQRPEGKRGAHKLKRLAWQKEIDSIVEENRLEKIESIEDLILVLVKCGYKVTKSKKDCHYCFENDVIFGLFGGEGDYPMSPYTENKICADIRTEFDKWSTSGVVDLEFLDKNPEDILLVLKKLENGDYINA